MVTLKVQSFGGRRVTCRGWHDAGPADGRPTGRSAGYALTDALVAILILAMALVLSLTALNQARDAADSASEVRRAHVLMAHLIEAAPHRYALSTGFSDDFAWSVATTVTGAERPIEVCRRAVALENGRSGRTYAAATLETCPTEPLA